MNGTDALTGRRAAGLDHLRQSIRDILTTPIGSRVMRRDYGSRLFQLVDAPMNRATLVQIYAATIEALARWEPRIRVERVVAAAAQPGRVSLDIHGVYVPEGRAVLLGGIEVGAA
ncbi:MAG: GPW/gp25 family protein [Lautropia sp.]|nr:GPW/gp25 family protein [Lautropia sp.]